MTLAFVMEQDILCLIKVEPDNAIHYLLVLPSELKQEAVSVIHNQESGHLGQNKSITKAE